MTALTDALDRLAPTSEWSEDWTDVLRRAGEDSLGLEPGHGGRRRLARRRTILLAVALVVVMAPVTALAAINHWWFLRTTLPEPTQTPSVVTRGSWSGHPWTLVAYPSKGYGLCWGVTFSGDHAPRGYPTMVGVTAGMASHGAADGIGCGSIVGIQMPHLIRANIPTVQFESLQTTAAGYPGWIAGVVPASAGYVVIRWSAKKPKPSQHILGSPREVVRVPTFAARVPGYHVRLFATPLPKALSRHTRSGYALPDPSSISGTNQRGLTVACFDATVISTNGAYPLSYCTP